jgi:hypothetical protein
METLHEECYLPELTELCRMSMFVLGESFKKKKKIINKNKTNNSLLGLHAGHISISNKKL